MISYVQHLVKNNIQEEFWTTQQYDTASLENTENNWDAAATSLAIGC